MTNAATGSLLIPMVTFIHGRSAKRLLILLIGCSIFFKSVLAESKESVIVLESFVVEARRINPHPWRYIAVQGNEILSQCDVDQTEAVARHVANSLELNRRLLPSGSWNEPTVPLTFIMFDFKPTKSIAPFVPKSMESKAQSGNFGNVLLDDTVFILGKGEEKAGGVDTGDFDTHCVVQNRWNTPWNWAGGASGRGPIPLGLLFRLNSAVPSMPAWFRYGLVGPCGVFRIRSVQNPESGAFLGMLVSAAKWLSDEETAALVKKYNYNHKLPTFPPLSDLFNLDREPKQSSLAGWPSPELMAEASLFVRWGMMPVATEKDKEPTGSNQQGLTSKAHSLNDVHQRAFGQFLERSRREPVTEAVFKDCFGFGYAEMQSILGRYLVTTAQEPFALNKNSIRGWSADAPVPSAREATADEIGRIIGDWLRMHAASLPSSSSAERDAYLQAAARVLERAVKDDNDLASSVRLLSPTDAQKESEEHGAEEAANNKKVFAISPAKIHDPALVAVYGLYYFDIGDTVSAKVMLEAAVRARTPRPAAYLALAQLNFNAASASPAGENGKVSAAQLAAVLTPLFTVVQSWNLSPEGYLLIAEAWSHSATRPSLPNLQVLIKGMKCYPFHSSLHSATAKLYAQWGYWEQANETIERALKFVDAPTAEKLRAEQSTWLKNSSLK